MDRFDARPSRPRVSFHLFFIGKNSRGHWVVQDQDHLRDGLFADRAEALRFALFEKWQSASGGGHGCPAFWSLI